MHPALLDDYKAARRRYVELAALSDLVSNVFEAVGTDLFGEVSWEELAIQDEKGDLYQAISRLWSVDEDYEEFPEFHAATAEAAALAAALFARLSSNEGREELIRLAAHFAGISMKAAQDTEAARGHTDA